MNALLWLLATWALVGLIAAVLFGLAVRFGRRNAARQWERECIFYRRQAD